MGMERRKKVKQKNERNLEPTKEKERKENGMGWLWALERRGEKAQVPNAHRWVFSGEF